MKYQLFDQTGTMRAWCATIQGAQADALALAEANTDNHITVVRCDITKRLRVMTYYWDNDGQTVRATLEGDIAAFLPELQLRDNVGYTTDDQLANAVQPPQTR